MKYEVVPADDFQNAWLAEAIDHDGDGDIYSSLFYGPQAKERAEEYAEWKNGTSIAQEAARAEAVGHVAGCICHDDPTDCIAVRSAAAQLGVRVGAGHEHPYRDPRCLPGLKREAVIGAEARVQALESVSLHIMGTAYGRKMFDEARAELERLKKS